MSQPTQPNPPQLPAGPSYGPTALDLHDIDYLSNDTELRTYQSDTHRCWTYVGPAGAVSITATNQWDYPQPADAAVCSDHHWLFTSRTTTVHRPNPAGDDCPISGGPCTHSAGGPLVEAFARWWDSTAGFDDAVSDDLADVYDATFGGAR
ncbi:hypothetical protein [Micromonospora peucetia]|uniref:Uncharacterized protein n=1 Tax=Micromonospora peucetia TaxID=47871 RepID=A0ABZ1EJV0_9ACTN|nr:hypothetical protein [Micromonospora peucetia]WSA34516.1 hypothetical protein OIE14_10980 [Micromonospora peucetia]